VRRLKHNQQLEPFFSEDDPYDVVLQEQVSNTYSYSYSYSYSLAERPEVENMR
jgi:hypothetical protein